MAALSKRRWLVLGLVFFVTAVASLQSFDPVYTPQHLTFVILPEIGTLLLLPTDPGAWITPDVRPAFTQAALAPAVPPRAPPV